jgi:hypothetical protein
MITEQEKKEYLVKLETQTDRLRQSNTDLLEALRVLTAIVNGCRISKKEKERHLDNARAALSKAEKTK